MPHTVTTVGVSLINPPQAITISPSALTGCGRTMRLGSQRPVPYTEQCTQHKLCTHDLIRIFERLAFDELHGLLRGRATIAYGSWRMVVRLTVSAYGESSKPIIE